jgi:uncharacterized membrane protein YkvA (DUF1232 family)
MPLGAASIESVAAQHVAVLTDISLRSNGGLPCWISAYARTEGWPVGHDPGGMQREEKRRVKQTMMQRLMSWLRTLRNEVLVLASVVGDRRTPWYARAFIGLVVAYCLSPIDLIPDFIPVLGLLDDALVVPIGVLIARWLVPSELLAEHRAHVMDASPWLRTAGTVVILAIWLLVALLSWRLFVRWRYG